MCGGVRGWWGLWCVCGGTGPAKAREGPQASASRPPPPPGVDVYQGIAPSRFVVHFHVLPANKMFAAEGEWLLRLLTSKIIRSYLYTGRGVSFTLESLWIIEG